MTPPTSELPVRLLRREAVLPRRAHEADAGLDLCSCEAHTIAPGERALIPTGLAVEIPSGWAGLVCPRSGLALKHGITLLNAPGIIDSGYRGEVSVIVHNTDLLRPFVIEPGDRIAQLLLVEVSLVSCVARSDLAGSERGSAGFGSTGTAGAGR